MRYTMGKPAYESVHEFDDAQDFYKYMLGIVKSILSDATLRQRMDDIGMEGYPVNCELWEGKPHCQKISYCYIYKVIHKGEIQMNIWDSFDELYNYIDGKDRGSIYDELVEEYHQNRDENYRKYVKFRVRHYKEKNEYSALYAQLYLRPLFRVKWFRKVVSNLRSIPLADWYYAGRPFENVFEYGHMPLYRDNTEEAPNFGDLVYNIKDNIKEYKELYENLADEKSKKVLFGILKARLTGDLTYYGEVMEDDVQYLESFLNINVSKAYIDCGGYVGDSSAAYIKKHPDFQKIIIYEPCKVYAEAARRVRGGGIVEVREKAVGKEEKAGSDIQIVRLDDDLSTERGGIGFIKMDVEGAELEALEGAKRILREEAPICAICVYHRVNDLLEILWYILQLNKKYRVFLRHYSSVFTETVMYFVPM